MPSLQSVSTANRFFAIERGISAVLLAALCIGCQQNPDSSEQRAKERLAAKRIELQSKPEADPMTLSVEEYKVFLQEELDRHQEEIKNLQDFGDQLQCSADFNKRLGDIFVQLAQVENDPSVLPRMEAAIETLDPRQCQLPGYTSLARARIANTRELINAASSGLGQRQAMADAFSKFAENLKTWSSVDPTYISGNTCHTASQAKLFEAADVLAALSTTTAPHDLSKAYNEANELLGEADLSGCTAEFAKSYELFASRFTTLNQSHQQVRALFESHSALSDKETFWFKTIASKR